MEWNYPVFERKVVKKPDTPAQTEGTVAKAAEYALPREEAFLFISGENRRPLLVLRECKTCNGTDDALLSRAEDNSRTFLMARWFQCVKLPTHVLEENHPFHALFGDEHPPHLFLSRWDGSDVIPLRGDQSRTELWDSMYAMLGRSSLGDAREAVKEIEKIVAQYDVMDERIALIEDRMDEAIEEEGPKSKKLRELKKDLDKANAELETLKKRETLISDLGLKKEAPPASPAGR
jgi:hypothetical protein